MTDIAVSCQTNTYSVGGTVSGLSGTLELQNNGGDTIPISNDGAFTFPTEIAAGGPYSVTVSDQPASQTCSVTNGSGTVGSSNVTNVLVTCSTNAYTVGGTVTGLNSSGLVLQNNGSDNLVVPSGATSFTFPTPVASGGTYSVTVFEQPAGLICVVSNGSGIVTGSNVTNVSVNCAFDPGR